MAVKLKDLAQMEDRLVAGHGMCLGCGIPLIFKIVLRATEDPIVVSNATGCLEVCTTFFPRTSWNCMWVHSAFENAAATAAGIEAMFKALKNKGKIPADKEIKFLATGGDGGTYDIGIQALSGAMDTLAGYFAVQPMLPAARAGQACIGFGTLHAASVGFYALKLALVLTLAWRCTSR